MSIEFDATYRAGAIYPDQPVPLPENTPIRVHVVAKPEKSDAGPPPSPRFTAEEFRARIAKYAVKVGTLPPDFSREDIYSDHDWMRYLIDTGILLRIFDEYDPQHQLVQAAIELLGNQNQDLYITTQNIAELWNVATRPTANNGLNLSPATVSRLFEEAIAPFCTVLTEQETSPSEFKRLLLSYNVVGKRVHDARLVAMLLTWKIDMLLTLNDHDFRRYEPEGITIVTPASIAKSNP